MLAACICMGFYLLRDPYGKRTFLYFKYSGIHVEQFTIYVDSAARATDIDTFTSFELAETHLNMQTNYENENQYKNRGFFHRPDGDHIEQTVIYTRLWYCFHASAKIPAVANR